MLAMDAFGLGIWKILRRISSFNRFRKCWSENSTFKCKTHKLRTRVVELFHAISQYENNMFFPFTQHNTMDGRNAEDAVCLLKFSQQIFWIKTCALRSKQLRYCVSHGAIDAKQKQTHLFGTCKQFLHYFVLGFCFVFCFFSMLFAPSCLFQ